MMPRLTTAVFMTALLLTGCMVGFFYAFSATVMGGLDAADPRVAVSAMREINGAVRNAFFFVTFFLTGPVLLLAAWLARRDGCTPCACWALAAGMVYLFGAVLVTAAVNVPLNEDLAELSSTAVAAQAGQIWQDYSPVWTGWNHLRTLASGLSLFLLGRAIFLWGGHRSQTA